MNFRCVSLLAVAILLGLASLASADIVVTLNTTYLGSYTADYSQFATLPVVDTPNGTGGTLETVQLPAGNIYVNHAFEYYLTVSGLTSDQNVVDFLFQKHVTGATTAAAGDWTLNNPGRRSACDGIAELERPGCKCVRDRLQSVQRHRLGILGVKRRDHRWPPGQYLRRLRLVLRSWQNQYRSRHADCPRRDRCRHSQFPVPDRVLIPSRSSAATRMATRRALAMKATLPMPIGPRIAIQSRSCRSR